jgi:predicted membrane-bound mannosyltransferase
MKKRALLAVLLTAFTAACIHKTGSPISAWERVNVNMAALAQINNDVAKGIISAQQAGVLTTQQATPILNYQEAVAKDHAAIENILATGSNQATSRAAEIQALLEEIRSQGTTLIQSGGLGVKNPKSQQTFSQDLQGIVNLTETVLADFQLAKGN